MDRYPVVLSTTYSLLRNCSAGHMFDVIIIDEASQSDILSSLLTMNIAKKMVVIGDDKQLPQIDNQEIYDFSEELARELNIGESYQYKENSILDSVLSLDNISNTVLKEHYRCELRIIQFCNKKSMKLINTVNSCLNNILTIKISVNHKKLFKCQLYY